MNYTGCQQQEHTENAAIVKSGFKTSAVHANATLYNGGHRLIFS